MAKKKSALQAAQEETQTAIDRVNAKINTLGFYTNRLYIEANIVQEMFDNIRNVPSDNHLKAQELKKIRLNWKHQAEKIERDYKNAFAKDAGAGMAAAGFGVAMAAMGPTAAMGVATTFGVASTGTAIAALHGAAATNAALAWLGGGTLLAGGGGVAAGKALLALAGPTGWVIAGIALLSSGIALIVNKNNKNSLEKIFTLISKRDVRSYNLAITELDERILRIDDESKKLHDAIRRMQSFGTDYSSMSEAEQYELGTYVNLLLSSTQLLTNPILGLQPKYTEEDYKSFSDYMIRNSMNINERIFWIDNKDIIMTLCNLLYKIDLSEKEGKLFWEALRSNKSFLESFDKKKKDFPYTTFQFVIYALNRKYR